MNLSKRGEYALRALIDIGIASSSAPPLGVRRVPWRELTLVLLGFARDDGVQAFGRSGVQEENPTDPNARTPERLNA